jgi:DNA-binding protein HU-beta
LNKGELVEAIAADLGESASRRDVERTLESFANVVKNELGRGEKVSITRFGSFEARSRSARTGRNPQTGESIQIQATTVPAFKPSKTLKDEVSQMADPAAKKNSGAKKSTAKKSATTKKTTGTGTKKATTKAATKKATGTAAKKSTTKKATGTAAKKSTTKKTTGNAAKKTTGTAAKKTTGTAAKKSTAKKATGTAAKKATTKRSTAKKSS